MFFANVKLQCIYEHFTNTQGNEVGGDLKAF
jgi:hypothetical protein